LDEIDFAALLSAFDGGSECPLPSGQSCFAPLCNSAVLRNCPSMSVRQATLCDIRVFFQEYTLQRLKCSDRNSFEKPDPDPEGGWKGQFRLIPTVVRRVFAAPGTGAFLILKRFECAGPFSKFYIKGRFYAAI
jgi:hypothetical protein